MWLCRVLGVWRSEFYRWCQAAPARAARQAADRCLAEQIRTIHAGSGATYRSQRVHAELRDQGHRVNRERIERVMREHRTLGRHLRRRCRTTICDPSTSPAPDLLLRDFSTGALNAAVATRGGNIAGVIFNSDHGAQYTCGAFADACADKLRAVQAIGLPTGSTVWCQSMVSMVMGSSRMRRPVA